MDTIIWQDPFGPIWFDFRDLEQDILKSPYIPVFIIVCKM